MEEKKKLKAAVRQVNQVGWSLLVYTLIMNVVVIVVMMVDAVIFTVRQMLETGTIDDAALTQYLMDSVTSNGWGYIISILIGVGILLLWKKPRYFKNIIFHKEKKMTVGTFFQLLAIFLCSQAILQVMFPAMEWCLNQVGYSSMAAMEMAAIQTTGFSMFLYVGFLGPIAEELLCRGLVLRLLQPYGKRFAIVLSALLFGLFHGNVVQIPFAFLVGLVLGYVTVEYSVVWAMVLHIINNFVLVELLSMLTAFMPMEVVDIIFYAILAAAVIASVIVLIVKRKTVAAYFRENKISFFSVEAAASSIPLWLFAMGMMLMGVLSITPLMS